ncbi:unnamed protein product, partial [Amoebophrya sp. A25]
HAESFSRSPSEAHDDEATAAVTEDSMTTRTVSHDGASSGYYSRKMVPQTQEEHRARGVSVDDHLEPDSCTSKNQIKRSVSASGPTSADYVVAPHTTSTTAASPAKPNDAGNHKADGNPPDRGSVWNMNTGASRVDSSSTDTERLCPPGDNLVSSGSRTTSWWASALSRYWTGGQTEENKQLDNH